VPVRGGAFDQRAHPGQHPSSRARHAGAEQLDLAAGGQHQAEQHPHGGRLPRAVGAEEAVDVAGPHVEVDAVHRPEPAVALDQAAGEDHRAHGLPPSSGSCAAASASASGVTVPVSTYGP
jgi:hypothetical protein